MHYSHIFGPVHSRRLGLSLGVDLVPCNVCSYDCIYCECGCTTFATMERREFFPVSEVVAELGEYLSKTPELDYLTFSGSGEPTLSLSIGAVIRYLKETFPGYRVAVLTNGTLLWREEVREALLPADVVIPTLSSVFEGTWRRIHRPAPGISLDAIISGIRQFRKEYTGEIWVEVFIIPGVNTDDRELGSLCALLRELHPDRVQLNTLDRPGTQESVRPASAEELERISSILSHSGVKCVEPVRFHPSGSAAMTSEWCDTVERIHELIRRKPSTLDDLAESTGLPRREILKILREIEKNDPVHEKREERGVFYSCS
jgi:wyosine [tRNA(Phe)-imidazoG37] synthetase (radical SAM superfamily)